MNLKNYQYYTLADRTSGSIFDFPKRKSVKIKFDCIGDATSAIIVLRGVQDTLKSNNYYNRGYCFVTNNIHGRSSSPYICDLVGELCYNNNIVKTICAYISKQILSKFSLEDWLTDKEQFKRESMDDFLKLQSTRIAFVDFIIEQIKIQNELT